MSFLARLWPRSSGVKAEMAEPAIVPLFPAQVSQVAAAAVTTSSLAEISIKELLSEFESIGNNCEFGLLQRHFEVDNISLMRWAGMQFDRLCNALEKKFEGFGENVSFRTLGVEHMVEETTYSAVFHTDRHIESISAAQLEPLEKKRLSFLSKAFVETLQEGSKILVYKVLRRLHGKMFVSLMIS